MANTWFQFKQFTVQQDACAMKVTTDACLFGAWCASLLLPSKSYRVLDIGTGTGLLSLMLAQQLPQARISAIEIDNDAARQAAANAAASPFAAQISLATANILSYESPQLFDLIICNPPFHEQQLRTASDAKNTAHHDAGLTLKQLLESAAKLTVPQSQMAILLPYYRKIATLAMAAEHGFYPQNVTDVKQTPNHSFFRTLLLLSKTPSPATQETLTICSKPQHYTPEFVTLLKDYYLHF